MAELQVPFRTTPIWPIPRSTLEYQASNRLKRLATPKIRNNIWSINMSEVGSTCLHSSGWDSGDISLWMQYGSAHLESQARGRQSSMSLRPDQ